MEQDHAGEVSITLQAPGFAFSQLTFRIACNHAIIRLLNPWALLSFYLLATIGFGGIGWWLQHKAFTPPPPAGQVYAAVFVRDAAARVSLSSDIHPDKPWTDGLTVAVSGTSSRKSGWLLVIECPAGAPSQSRAVSRAGLNPSLNATNQQAEVAASHDTFMAGVLFGIASGTLVAFVDKLWNIFSEKKDKKKEETSDAGQSGSLFEEYRRPPDGDHHQPEPELDDDSPHQPADHG